MLIRLDKPYLKKFKPVVIEIVDSQFKSKKQTFERKGFEVRKIDQR